MSVLSPREDLRFVRRQGAERPWRPLVRVTRQGLSDDVRTPWNHRHWLGQGRQLAGFPATMVSRSARNFKGPQIAFYEADLSLIWPNVAGNRWRRPSRFPGNGLTGRRVIMPNYRAWYGALFSPLLHRSDQVEGRTAGPLRSAWLPTCGCNRPASPGSATCQHS